MIDWFTTTLTAEQQVGLLTLVLTLLGSVLIKGRAPPHKQVHRPPALAEITCGFLSGDHDRIERLEENVRVIRETQIEMLTLVRSNRNDR